MSLARAMVMPMLNLWKNKAKQVPFAKGFSRPCANVTKPVALCMSECEGLPFDLKASSGMMILSMVW